MSLDTSHFIEAVEDHFGIKFEISDGKLVPTIGDLADVILAHLHARWTGVVCPTRRAFFEIRSTIQRSLNIVGLRIRPSTKLIELIPYSQNTSAAVRLRYQSPAKLETVGDLARNSIGWFLGHHGVGGITKESVLAELLPIVADEFGVDEEKMHADIRFVEDLDVA